MARIPDAGLERLKGDVSLVRLIDAQGHRLTARANRGYNPLVAIQDE